MDEIFQPFAAELAEMDAEGQAAFVEAGEAQVLAELYGGDPDKLAEGIEEIRDGIVQVFGHRADEAIRQLNDHAILASPAAHRVILSHVRRLK